MRCSNSWSIRKCKLNQHQHWFSPKLGKMKCLMTSRFSKDVRKVSYTLGIHLAISSKIENVHTLCPRIFHLGVYTLIPTQIIHKVCAREASLVVQWLRIHLSMQGTPFGSLIRESPTCHGAAEPVHHSYWVCILERENHNCPAHLLQLLKPACPGTRAPQQGKPLQPEACAPQLECSPCSPQLEKACVHQWRPSTAKA